MSIDVAILVLAVFALALLAAGAWGIFRRSGRFARGDSLVRIDTRLNDQAQLAESRSRNLEELVRNLDRELRAAQPDLQQVLERRLTEVQTSHTEATAELRSGLAERFEQLKREVGTQLADGRTGSANAFAELREQLLQALGEHRTRSESRQSETLKALQDSLHSGMESVRSQLGEALTRNAEELSRRVEGLTQITDSRLKDISGAVERRLTEGFERTTATFADVLKRLALIDEAQKKITELSSNVVSLQEVLSDKRSRGAFGEVQLSALLRNVLPESAFALQHTLSNDRVADCVLFLPAPTGRVAIDAKFPLEAYQRMTDIDAPESERRMAERQFKQDVRRHVQDIAERYIIPGETSDGAVMFIPAEAVFAEIQAHHPDVVQAAHQARVWMVSPTTLMAILNTARAVIKDEATRREVHIIQEHLSGLAKDFERFQRRMNNLARHVQLAHRDVEEVHVSAQKISNRFGKIEAVELEHEEPERLEPPAGDSQPAD